MLLNEKETILQAVVYGLKAAGMNEQSAKAAAAKNCDKWCAYARASAATFGFTPAQSWQYALAQVRNAAQSTGPVAPEKAAPSPLRSAPPMMKVKSSAPAPKLTSAPTPEPAPAPTKTKKK